MPQFTIFTPETAPADSADLLRDLQDTIGFIPNIHATFAASPAALEALISVNAAFGQSGFSAAEREVISLTASIFNQCSYCVAGHSVFGRSAGLSSEAIEAIRSDSPLSDPRFEALRSLTREVLAKRGAVSEVELLPFLQAGFRLEQFLDLLVGIAAKIMTNFVSKAAGTPLDSAFRADAWTSSAKSNPTLEDV